MTKPALPAEMSVGEETPGKYMPDTKIKFFKSRTSIVIEFFSRLNPAHWFHDLSNIEITMEELSSGIDGGRS